jgi:tRNA pseudouridine55 synthase
VDGVIVVDKPEGMTSHDVVNRVRRLAGTRRVGHLGTLDPMATGVLPLVIGRATRMAQFFTTSEKSYEATIDFGHATNTYDRDGSPVSDPVTPSFSRAELEQALDQFRGTFAQTPPPVSAKKVAGVPSYKLARKQMAVELKPVEVTVHALELRDFDGRRARVFVRCSAGTYVRGIAHDLGQRLGCGAFVGALRRTASGDFSQQQSKTLDELRALAEAGSLGQALLPAAELLPEFPCELVDSVTAGMIRQGRDFRLSPFRMRADARHVKALTREGELVAIGEARLPNVYHPVVVL